MIKVLKFITLLLFSTNIAFADTQEDLAKCKSFITNLSNEAIAIIKDSSLSEDQKFNILKEKFLNNVDVKWISRFVLGPDYRNLTEKQQNLFNELYKEFLVNAYVPKFKEFNQDKIRIESASQVGDRRYKVSTVIDRINNSDVRVDYMIKPSNTKEGTLQIYDIVAEDVSMITNHRTEFTSVMAQKGFDGMINHLKSVINQYN